jgi:N-acylglucosamine-6-phosphate 2-epimerase
MPEMLSRRVAIGTDLGASKTAAALVTEGGSVLERLTASTSAERGPESVLHLVAEQVGALQALARAQGARVDGLGVGITGMVDRASGALVASTESLPNWRGNIADHLQQVTGMRSVNVSGDHAARSLAPLPALLERLRGGLIVSCQAMDGHPFEDPEVIARLARAASLGGAAGLRVNSAIDIRAVKKVTELPVIGIQKVRQPSQRTGRYLITPRLDLAAELVDAGADVIAMEATSETPVTDLAALDLLALVRSELGVPVVADISTEAEGLQAWAAGTDLVATTLSGYTAATAARGPAPDLDLVARLGTGGVRVVAEGRYATPDDVAAAFARGAFAVVVGTAITDPVAITRRFAAVAPAANR